MLTTERDLVVTSAPHPREGRAKPSTKYARLYLDRHIKKQLALDLREHDFEVLTTEEAAKDSAPDEEQLAFAAKETGPF